MEVLSSCRWSRFLPLVSPLVLPLSAWPVARLAESHAATPL
ncbi:hypothetical protein [Streptomyces avermitilis]